MGFWDDFSGKSAKKDIRAANAKAEAAVDRGNAQAQGYYDQAYGEYAPYAGLGQQGMADQNIYRQAIGLGTPEERAAAQDRYFSDPAYARMNDQNQNAMMRYQNARGSVGGGKAALAGARVANEGYQGWLDRTRDVGQNAMATGFGAASARAGIRTGQADQAWGYGTTKAGNAVNYGNAMAASRGILTNNLLNIAGTAAKAYATGAAA